MNKTVLVLNAGSSSIKFTVYTSDGAQLTTRYYGQIEGLGSQPHWLAKDAQGQLSKSIVGSPGVMMIALHTLATLQ